MVAAGSGSRLGAGQPKALVPVAGVPMVRLAVEAMASGGAQTVVVTCPASHRDAFEEALDGLAVSVSLVSGGAERQDSVRLAVEALGDLDPDTVVLVHDAARPLVPSEVVERVIRTVSDGASAVVPVVPVVDTVREVDGGVVPRDRLRAVQTPQGFPLPVLRRAHQMVQDRGLTVTDDAGAAEAAGFPVSLVEGHRWALKITEPLDLRLAQTLLEGPR